MRILHLDDDADDSELLRLALLTAGHIPVIRRVEEKETFMEGLAEARIDLIISDMSVPGFSGKEAWELARRLRPDVPFVYLCGAVLLDEEGAGAEAPVLRVRKGRLEPLMAFLDDLRPERGPGGP